jgi:apolipoprotein N-acyltransferase
MHPAGPRRIRSLSLKIAATLAAGVLLRLAQDLHPLWWLAWVAPVPVLVLALRSRGPDALGLVFAASLVGATATLHYRWLLFPPADVVIATLLQALAWTLVVMETRRLVNRFQAAWTVLAYPVLWVALDTLVAVLRRAGNETSLAYTQADCLPILQVTSLAGIGGLLFLLALVPSALALALGRSLRRAWLAPAGTALVLAAAIIFGLVRLHRPAPAPETALGLVAIDEAIGPNASASYRRSIWDAYDRAIATLAAQGAEILVLPEKIGLVTPAVAAEWQEHLGGLAARHHLWIEAGVGIDDAGMRVNQAWLFAPDGDLAGTYRKQHLSPGEARDFVPGHDTFVQRIQGRIYGLAICKDMFSAALGRAYGSRGAAVMLVPAWNPTFEDAGMEGRNTRVRGVENGYAVVRAAREGFLTVSDAYGRIVAEKRSSRLPGTVLLARLPGGGRVPTLYSSTGDLFGWTCVGAAAVLLAAGRRADRPAGRIAAGRRTSTAVPPRRSDLTSSVPPS